MSFHGSKKSRAGFEAWLFDCLKGFRYKFCEPYKDIFLFHHIHPPTLTL